MPQALDYTINSEDIRLIEAGYVVCGSGGDTQWHWRKPGGRWHDNYRSEYAAANAALAHLKQHPR